MTLPDLLADDLLAWLHAAADDLPRRVLLWLDPRAEFSRLVAHLAPALEARGAHLLRYAPDEGVGQLQLKLELLRLDREPDGRAVVYLPGFDIEALEPRPDGRAPGLWSVIDRRYKEAIWGRGGRWEPGELTEPPSLLSWLRRHGVQVADARTERELAAGGADAPLARFAERLLAVEPERWHRPLRRSDVEASLAGDPRDALRALLVAPANEVRRWGIERPTVLTRIAAEYGLVGPSADAEPDALADAFALNLALAEAWDAFGRPADFPYLSRLPRSAAKRERQVAFLRGDVLGHTDLGPRFRARVRHLEASYPLADWAGDRPGQPGGLPLLARARWQRFVDRLSSAAATSWKTARDLLVHEQAAIDAAASAPWAGLDGEIAWPLLRDLAELVALAASMPDEAASLDRPAALVGAYAERWWRLDRLHLDVRAGAHRQALNVARPIADHAYLDAVSRVSDRFALLVEQEGVWPPRDTRGVAEVRAALWSPIDRGRRAVIVTDACRWDLARSLAEALGSDCSVKPLLGTLPSNTPFGMTTLLPLGDAAMSVDFETGAAVIRRGSPANLATRDGRKAFLEAALAKPGGKSPLAFIELGSLLRDGPMPSAPLVVVFDNALDEQGHKGTEQLPLVADQLVVGLRRAIERLHEAGVETVHLVTDHGFLLLPPAAVDDLGTPQVLPAQALYKHARWAALKPDAPNGEVIRLPLPLAPTICLGLPRGVRTLVKAEPFLHGGLSLQECVVPHLVSRRAAPRNRVGLDFQVSVPHLAGGTVPVILRPRQDTPQPALFGVQPLHARLWVETVAAGDQPA
ncbi:MAG: PglZ domain-containing protein, partial [Chloroflexi bacterium]|nr:PglZ domain-containing protein [Chloroflexota bacterium]